MSTVLDQDHLTLLMKLRDILQNPNMPALLEHLVPPNLTQTQEDPIQETIQHKLTREMLGVTVERFMNTQK